MAGDELKREREKVQRGHEKRMGRWAWMRERASEREGEVEGGRAGRTGESGLICLRGRVLCFFPSVLPSFSYSPANNTSSRQIVMLIQNCVEPGRNRPDSGNPYVFPAVCCEMDGGPKRQ
jgi:hypothetical protein